MPNSAIVLICTRWHSDDLAGRLIEAQSNGGDQWRVISLEAITNEGTPDERALWPEWYPLPALHRIRSAIGHRDWAALYQQNPQPDAGTYFQRGWFKRFDIKSIPERLNRYAASDFAVTSDGGDFTEHGIFGVDASDDLFVIDWWFGQATADVWIDSLIDKWAEHKPLAWFEEAGVIRKSIEPFLVKRSRERRVYCRMEWLASIHDKPTRARAFQARAAMGKVWIPNTQWGDRLIDQLVAFPAGKHDDAVDVCSLIGMAIDQSHPAIVPVVESSPKRDRWLEASKRNTEPDGWKAA